MQQIFIHPETSFPSLKEGGKEKERLGDIIRDHTVPDLQQSQIPYPDTEIGKEDPYTPDADRLHPERVAGLSHAVIDAFQHDIKAEERLGTKWLMGAVMYVTLEPCSMCAGALVLSRISRLVIGADDPKTGACGSLYDIAGDPRLNHRIETERGVLADICSEQLRGFFRNRRKTTEENI